MLSAAVAVLCAAVMAARADTELSTLSTDTHTTTTDGNLTIDSSGGIQVKTGGAAVTITSHNFVINNGVISNGDNDTAGGILIDTSAQNIVAPVGTGLTSSNTITITGTGEGKNGVEVLGPNHFFGAITLNNLTPAGLLGAGATITMSGDTIAAFRMDVGSFVDGDIAMGGSITAQAPTTPASGSETPILANLGGTLYGNLAFDSTTAGSSVGEGSRGILITGGGIHPCSDDNATQATVGYTCGTGANGLGALINAGKLVTVGQVLVNANPKSKAVILEGGSVLGVGASILGGIYNSGPFTANSAASVGVFSGNGTSGLAVVQIDPTLNTVTTPQAVYIGPVSAQLDNIDPGYSFINRGSIAASPAAPQVGTAAMFVEGASSSVFTCFGSGASLATCASGSQGGMLNTGTIDAKVTTNATTVVTTNVTADALIIGPYAAIPRLDLKAEDTGLGTATVGTISAEIGGTTGGIATAISIGQNAILPTINVGQGATISATVATTTLAPSASIATAADPLTLSATAITDASGPLTTINNAGRISAAISIVTPGVGASVVTSVRAIDLSASTANNITINDSGRILGDVNFGSGGNNYALNVGNTGSSGGGGAANPATGIPNSPNNYAVVAYSIESSSAGSAPITTFNTINFGSGGGHVLHVGAFGYVDSVITSSPGALAVTVDPNGTLFVANTGDNGSLNASTFDINGGVLGLTISQNTTATTPVIRATTEATIQANSTVAMQFGSFVSSGTTLASVTNPTTQHLVLISAPVITIDANTLALNNAVLSQNLPFLFQPDPTPLSISSGAGSQTLELRLTPRVPGAGTTSNPGLGLSGDALAQFPFIASALATDSGLGASIATSLTVYNTPGVSASGINVAASQQVSQQAFSQFGPDTSGGARQVAILITDQASGPVAARQRLLRAYDKAPGDLTLWGTEFAGNINNKGRVDADGTLTDYKDHGIGFSLGLDGGSPRDGWYGGAFTFYSGDVTQSLPRDTQTHTTWYMLTGYSSWKGNHLFLDTQLSTAYGDFNGIRTVDVGDTERDASGKRAGLMGAMGANMGAVFKVGGLQITPHFSLDGLSLREEGYSETGGGTGLDLQVAPYYANSLRAGAGVDFSAGLNLFGVTVKPEARFGYRYDLANSPVKLKAGFLSTGGLTTPGNSMTFVGPDPDTGNLVGGISLSAGTDTWHLGAHYDYLRGNNGSVTQVGTLTLLGRI